MIACSPGRNYSCDAPALHYLRQMAHAAGFDALSTSYGFQQTGADPVGGPESAGSLTPISKGLAALPLAAVHLARVRRAAGR